MSSSVRWYNPETLEIVSKVPSADGKKEVNATIAHARKQGFLPSVTSILSTVLAGGQGLEDWKTNQVIVACMSFPFDQDPENDAIVSDYKKMIKAKSKEVANKAAEEGNILHGYMNRWMETKEIPDDPIGKNMISKIVSHLSSMVAIHGQVTAISSEIPVGSKELGFCGTPDVHITFADGFVLIADLKSVDFKKYKAPYDSQRSQLGGYCILTKSKPDTTLQQWVVDRATGDMIFFEHEEPEKWVKHFQCLYECFAIMKKYDARTVV